MPSVDNKRPLKVFLCHAHADRDPVRRLYSRLTQDGVDAWFDKAKLLPGQDWELEIRKAVREADVVVVCLSKQFNQAGFRQKEVRLALDTAMEKPEGEIFIIPARLEECDTLESLRKWHWVNLFEDDGYEMLMRALRARADRIEAILERTTRKKIKSDSALKAAQEKAERETVEKVAREKAEQEAAEKARLDAEELARQKAIKEKAEREAAEKVAREIEATGKARLDIEEDEKRKAIRLAFYQKYIWIFWTIFSIASLVISFYLLLFLQDSVITPPRLALSKLFTVTFLTFVDAVIYGTIYGLFVGLGQWVSILVRPNLFKWLLFTILASIFGTIVFYFIPLYNLPFTTLVFGLCIGLPIGLAQWYILFARQKVGSYFAVWIVSNVLLWESYNSFPWQTDFSSSVFWGVVGFLSLMVAGYVLNKQLQVNQNKFW